MKTLVITNFPEKYYEESISDLAARDDVIVIKNPRNTDDLREQLEKHRGEFDEVFINTHGSLGKTEPNLKITNSDSLTIPEIIALINHRNGDFVKDIHLASCHVGSHFEALENSDVSDKYYSDLSHSLQPGQTLFLHGDEHISTTREGKSRLLAIADHESGPITHSILASSEELKVIHRNQIKNLRGSPSFTIFEHTPYSEFASDSGENPLEHLRSYLANSLEKAKRFEIDNGIFHDPTYAKRLSKLTDEDLKKYLNEAFELELIKSPDPMQVMHDWGYLLKSGVVDVRHDNNDWTMLMYSAYHGHVDAVKALLADSEVGEKFAKKGEAALIVATRNNQKEVVEVLLDSDRLDLSHNSKSVNLALNLAKEKGLTPISELIEDRILEWRIGSEPQKFLFELVEKGDEETLKKVIDKKKIDLDIRDENGETALIHAVKKQNAKIVKLLADNGAYLNLSDKNGNTALKEAVNVQDFNIIELLHSYDGTIRSFGQEYSQKLLTWAVETGNHATVKALLMADKEFDINFFTLHGNSRELTPLEIAVINRDIEAAKFLLEDERIKPETSSDISYNGKDIQHGHKCPAFVQAAINNDIEMVKLFVAKSNEGKADVNVATNALKVPTDMTKSGWIYLGYDNETPLIVAAQSGYTDVVKELCKADDLNLNYRNIANSTALLGAIKGGFTEIVEILVNDLRTDLDIDYNGKTALEYTKTIESYGTKKLRGSNSLASLIEESQKCRQIAKNNFLPGQDSPQFIDPKLSIDDPHHQRQINDLNMLGFGQVALFLVGAGLLVKYFMGRGNQKPSGSVDAESAKKMSEETSKDTHDKSH